MNKLKLIKVNQQKLNNYHIIKYNNMIGIAKNIAEFMTIMFINVNRKILDRFQNSIR